MSNRKGNPAPPRAGAGHPWRRWDYMTFKGTLPKRPAINAPPTTKKRRGTKGAGQ